MLPTTGTAANPAMTNQWFTTAGSSYIPNMNVVWQDTSSNATYCSAAQALTSGRA